MTPKADSLPELPPPYLAQSFNRNPGAQLGQRFGEQFAAQPAVPEFTAKQMHAYGKRCYEAGRQAAPCQPSSYETCQQCKWPIRCSSQKCCEFLRGQLSAGTLQPYFPPEGNNSDAQNIGQVGNRER